MVSIALTYICILSFNLRKKERKKEKRKRKQEKEKEPYFKKKVFITILQTKKPKFRAVIHLLIHMLI